MQQKITFNFVLCQVRLILFNTNLITKNNISYMKTVLNTLNSLETLWNRDTNVKIIFSWWTSFYNSFEVCFNLNLIIVCTFHCKRDKTMVLGIIIACHPTPTWWVACNFSHVYSLWISWRGMRLSHAKAIFICQSLYCRK